MRHRKLAIVFALALLLGSCDRNRSKWYGGPLKVGTLEIESTRYSIGYGKAMPPHGESGVPLYRPFIMFESNSAIEGMRSKSRPYELFESIHRKEYQWGEAPPEIILVSKSSAVILALDAEQKEALQSYADDPDSLDISDSLMPILEKNIEKVREFYESNSSGDSEDGEFKALYEKLRANLSKRTAGRSSSPPNLRHHPREPRLLGRA